MPQGLHAATEPGEPLTTERGTLPCTRGGSFLNGLFGATSLEPRAGHQRARWSGILVGFERLREVEAGGSRTAVFELSFAAVQDFDSDGRKVARSGTYRLRVGDGGNGGAEVAVTVLSNSTTHID